jgi:FkbM family methyltransferase
VRSKLRNLLRLLRWWRRQVPLVRTLVSSPRGARWHLLSLDVPGGLGWNWELWPRLAPEEFLLDLGRGQVFFSGKTINGDRGAFSEIFVAGQYRSDYRDGVVVDVGAHKGYFGAWALLQGAKAVLSYEPEARNFALLDRAAATFRAHGADWRVVRAAVGARERTADLVVSRDSWSHSLHHVAQGERREVQNVNVVALRDVLERARKLGGRTLVKIDVEGLECELVLETSPEAWAGVDEVFVEVHAFAPCRPDQLVAHLGMRAVQADGLLHLTR